MLLMRYPIIIEFTYIISITFVALTEREDNKLSLHAVIYNRYA